MSLRQPPCRGQHLRPGKAGSSVFAEIAITTNGGPGNESTNMTYMIFKQSLMNFDVGVASAGALFAVVLANIVAVFLIRIIGKNLD